jgi:hypothetical protein
MTEKTDHPAATHRGFPYYFSDVEGFFLSEPIIIIEVLHYDEDLKIYYDDLIDPNYTQSWCTRWDTSDYSITIETWLDKEGITNIVNNLRPGAVSELYQVLGKPFYYDQSWIGANTLRISPNIESESNLKNMRKETIIYPKNISTSPVAGRKDWFVLKIEGYISGSSL